MASENGGPSSYGSPKKILACVFSKQMQSTLEVFPKEFLQARLFLQSQLWTFLHIVLQVDYATPASHMEGCAAMPVLVPK